LVAVLGPTCSGKSSLALRLASEFGGEIVNCDSVQVYAGLDVGTAKTPPEARQGVPHHLVSFLRPDEVFTAGDYAAMARQVLGDIAARGRLPVLVGGTGFYLRALLEGLAEGPRRDDALRARLAAREAARPGSLHRILSRLDRRTASRIHANDRNKLIRALEICLLARRPAQAVFDAGKRGLSGYRTLKIVLDPPRPLLHARIDARTRAIFAGGLELEVRRLLESGLPPAAKALESIGYKETLQMIEGRLSFEEALERTTIATRQYAKRQLTWFRREQDAHWFSGFGDDPEVVRSALLLAEHHLAVNIK
jgi:tRNA dimethylallyltransferase